MAISLDKALGIHQHALQGRVQRAEVLANNLANADTPGFKARDVDFQAMMEKAQNQASGFSMSRTHSQHLDTGQGGADTHLMYRTPNQPSVDGNTVEPQDEQARFMRNAMDYQASFQFLKGKFDGMKKALSGQ